MTIREYIGEEKVKDLQEKFEDFLNSEDGFLIMCNPSKERISDLYKGFCKNCILEHVEKVVNDADKTGLLAKTCN